MTWYSTAIVVLQQVKIALVWLPQCSTRPGSLIIIISGSLGHPHRFIWCVWSAVIDMTSFTWCGFWPKSHVITIIFMSSGETLLVVGWSDVWVSQTLYHKTPSFMDRMNRLKIQKSRIVDGKKKERTTIFLSTRFSEGIVDGLCKNVLEIL